MIKKRLFKYGSVFMCAALMACSLAACSANTASVETPTSGVVSSTEDVLGDAINKQLNASSAKKKNVSSLDDKNTKDETVYVFTDVTGKQDHLIVNEKLKNGLGLATIEDASSLSDVQNMTGDETVTTGSNDKLTWAANGNSITYQGTTTKQAPVTIKVTYYLDGKEIKAEDLAGKSGKVRIRFDYINNEKKTITVNGKSKTAYVPFTMVTGMMLPTEKFSNVEVVNGKITEANGSQVVLGVAMPGLKDSLNLSLGDKKLDIDIPEYVEVTADVTDFALDSVMSVATSGVFSNVDLDEMNFDDVKGQANDLDSAANQLADGTERLSDGANRLSDATGTIQDVTKQIADGANRLYSGSSDLANGTGQLNGKVPTLVNGISQIDTGAGALAGGIGQLFAKMPTLTQGITQLHAGSGALKDGTDKLQQGVAALKDGTSQLASDETGIPALQSGIAAYTQGVGSANTGAAQLQGGTKQVADGLASLADSFTGDGTQENPGMINGVAALGTGSKQLSDGIAKLADTLDASFDEVKSNADAKSAEVGAALAQAKTLQDTFAANLNPTLGTIDANLVVTPYTELSGVSDALKAVAAGTMSQQDASASLQALYTKYMTAYAVATANANHPAVVQMNQALAASGLSLAGVYQAEMGLLLSTISSGSAAGALSQVYNTATTTTDPETGLNLSESLAKLKAGASSLNTGIVKIQTGIGTAAQLAADSPVKNPKTLCEALNALISGSATVNEGAAQLKTGLSQLAANNEKLNSGAQSAAEGAKKLDAGAGQLTDEKTGVPALAAGATQLNTGLSQLAGSTPDLTSGINALNDGAKQLKAGTAQLNAGSTELANGVKQLDDGANQLKDGLSTLSDGTGQLSEGAVQLNDGVIELADGAITLKDGMLQFNEEGIKKITDLLGTDASDVTETLKKVVELGKNYQSFAGKADETEGTVTFVYKTAGIEK